MHKGIDFAVPTGTPVMAAGCGTVEFAGRERGYGNFVLVNHGNGYSTAYGHLSRFASGIHTGAHVHQGQVIAYIGHDRPRHRAAPALRNPRQPARRSIRCA